MINPPWTVACHISSDKMCIKMAVFLLKTGNGFLSLNLDFLLYFVSVPLHIVECTTGTFGVNCASRCYCADQAERNTTTGQCPADCAPGYRGESCHSGKRFKSDCPAFCLSFVKIVYFT